MELTGLAYPEEYGGAGADLVTQAIVAEELARVDASASLMFLISKLAMLPVINFASDELKARYLPRIVSGESQGSYCLSEADAGSDVAAMTMRAVRDGDDYVLSRHEGVDHQRGHLATSTRCSPRPIRRPGTGASARSSSRGTGACRSPSSSTSWASRARRPRRCVLDEVRVPAANLIGEEGQGFYYAMHTLDRSRPTIGAQAVGIAQGALDYAVGYMKERRTFGQPLAENQGLQWMVADTAMRIEAARGLVYRACALVDEGDPDGELSVVGAMAKCFASDVAMQVTTDAVQLLGGYGYTTDFPVERMMRDAKITQIYEGTNQIQRMVIAKRLLG